MSNSAFSLGLLAQGQDMDQRVRLWNGYLGWKLPPRIKGECEPDGGFPKLVVNPPDGDWPELTEEEKEIIEALAEQHGGHPEFNSDSMNFSGRTFCEEVDLSGLIFIAANFDKAEFKSKVRFSEKTRFYAQSKFFEAVFEEGLVCWRTWFEADVYFTGSRFKGPVWCIGTEFMGGVSFGNVVFEKQAKFDGRTTH